MMLMLLEELVASVSAHGAKLRVIIIVIMKHILNSEQSKCVNKLVQCAKESYYKDILETVDSRSMYSTLNTLLNKTASQLPDTDSAPDLCNSFARYFTQKVVKIRKELDELPVVQSNYQTVICDGFGTSSIKVLNEFKSVSADDVKKIILATKNKSCSWDKIPMHLLKENIDCLIKPITTITDVSFSSGVFPMRLREAVVSPILKTSTMDKNILKNYNPVSNVSYISKIMEKLVYLR